MTDDVSWIPEGIDMTKASSARVYDWWLGGEHNFRIDQDAARAMISVVPTARASARAYRDFLIRAVRYLAGEAGIRQFLDIGSGIPTEQNVHEVAQAIAPGAKVVYADSDDVAVAHSELILAGNPDATVILADLRDPRAILDHPETKRLLDFSQPVAVLLSAVLHFVSDDEDPAGLLAALRAPLAPGSHLLISQSSSDVAPEVATAFASAYSRRVSAQPAFRPRAEIARFFDGFDLVAPGLVWLPEWRPDSPADVPADPSVYWGVAGVARLTD